MFRSAFIPRLLPLTLGLLLVMTALPAGADPQFSGSESTVVLSTDSLNISTIPLPTSRPMALQPQSARNPYTNPGRLFEAYRKMQEMRRDWDILIIDREEILARLTRVREAEVDGGEGQPVINRLLTRLHEQVTRENRLVEDAGRLMLLLAMAAPGLEKSIEGKDQAVMNLPESQHVFWLEALHQLSENKRREFADMLFGSRLGYAVHARLSESLWEDRSSLENLPLESPVTVEMQMRWEQRLEQMDHRNRQLAEQLEAQRREIQRLKRLLGEKLHEDPASESSGPDSDP